MPYTCIHMMNNRYSYVYMKNRINCEFVALSPNQSTERMKL